MKERIKEFIDYKGISAGELAAMLEVQRSNISHILNGRNKPGAALIEKMLIVFPKLNARWLFTGEGNMIEGDSNSNIGRSRIPQAVIEPNTTNHVSSVSKQSNTKKHIDKVVLLYNDGTFDTYDNIK